ncbi:hypothetical protein GCM10009634_15440 [Saccharothrix xinjiangensis]
MVVGGEVVVDEVVEDDDGDGSADDGEGLGALVGGCETGWGCAGAALVRWGALAGGCSRLPCSDFGGPAASRRCVTGIRVVTVTKTVDVLPSGAIVTEVSIAVLISACGSGGPASGGSEASTDARAAIAVATTAPPAASRTTGENFFFGFGFFFDCGVGAGGVGSGDA